MRHFFPDEELYNPKPSSLTWHRCIKFLHCTNIPTAASVGVWACLSPNVAESSLDQLLIKVLVAITHSSNQIRYPSAHKLSLRTCRYYFGFHRVVPRKGRYLHVTHPSATKYCYFVRHIGIAIAYVLANQTQV